MREGVEARPGSIPGSGRSPGGEHGKWGIAPNFYLDGREVTGFPFSPSHQAEKEYWDGCLAGALSTEELTWGTYLCHLYPNQPWQLLRLLTQLGSADGSPLRISPPSVTDPSQFPAWTHGLRPCSGPELLSVQNRFSGILKRPRISSLSSVTTASGCSSLGKGLGVFAGRLPAVALGLDLTSALEMGFQPSKDSPVSNELRVAQGPPDKFLVPVFSSHD